MELKEGDKILKVQIHLMDEKIMEICMKLDWRPYQIDGKINKRGGEVRQLCANFTLLSDFS